MRLASELGIQPSMLRNCLIALNGAWRPQAVLELHPVSLDTFLSDRRPAW
jgi:hypothetical protein